jgi:integrin beta 3
MNDVLREGWAEALGEILARERAAWRHERDLAVAEHGRQIAELRAEAAEAILRLSDLVAERLASVDPVVARRLAELETIGTELEARAALLHDGKDGAEGPPGPAGAQGETPDVQPVLERLEGLAATLEDRAAALRDGEDGKDGAPGPPGKPGELPIVRLWTEGVHYLGDVVAHKGSTWQARRDTAREPPDDEWALLAAAGRDAPEGEVCGSFDPSRSYRKFDLVCFDGCEWRARCDEPRSLPGVGWALSAVQGKRGGKGEKGDRGERGAPGAPGAVITDWVIDGFRATPLLSDGTLGPALELRSFFEAYHSEAAR